MVYAPIYPPLLIKRVQKRLKLNKNRGDFDQSWYVIVHRYNF